LKTNKKHAAISDNAIEWIVVGLGLAALIVFGQYGMPQKWHAAIMWTVVAFGPPTATPRKRWSSPSFWGLWTLYFVLHLLTMWVVFEYLLAKVRVLGTLYVVPFAAVEALVLLVLFSKRQSPHSLPLTR
jgi:hypothetical protein